MPPKKVRVEERKRTQISSTGIAYKKTILKERTGEDIDEYRSEYTIDDHILSIKELETRYDTNVKNGLTQEKADEVLQNTGPNCLVAAPSRSRLLIFLDFLFCGFAALLWVGAILSFVSYGITVYTRENAKKDNLYLGIVLVFVNVFTGVFGYYQESTNVAIMDSFKKMTPKYATVIRDGKKKSIPCEEVVLGDLVELNTGEWIPADLRLVAANNLKVDNSAITGESLPQNRSTNYTHKLATETANVAFLSTSVIEGSGRGIVINVGDHTLIGHIAGLASTLQKSQTPIRREINHFIKIITVIALVTGGAFFAACMVLKYDFFESFTYFIALVVANVPEGLPVTLTACMTLTAKRMAVKNCLVKKLEAIETLGCCNVICSDKTGTLTQNKMTVTHIYYDTHLPSVLQNYSDVDLENLSFQALANIGILCSRATFVVGQEKVPVMNRKTVGDASESAILKFMEKITQNVEKKRRDMPKMCEIPFNSTNKYQVSVHRRADGSFVVMMKGAPEQLLGRCSTILRNGRTIPFSKELLQEVKKVVNLLGQKGERVLAFADLDLNPQTYPKNYAFDSDKPNFPVQDLRLVGLISMMDPPRPSVPDAVEKCRSAGIRVIMVTGDHPITAAAISKQVGILSPKSITTYDIAVRRDVSVSLVSDSEKKQCNAAVVTGQDLREMSSQELKDTIIKYEEIVFARTTPQQKLKIVEAFQSLNKVVAVTGDGVNDSPALKKADIGIAMGITGSDVSKDAADMILLDDNFSSIVTGIEEGRLIFDNLKKSIAYLLTSNVPEIVPFVLMVLLNMPPPLSVIAVIVIDAGTDLWPAISLAYEKAEADIMRRNPRDPTYDKLVNSRLLLLTYAQIGVIQACASMGCYFYIMAQHGFFWNMLFGVRESWENPEVIKDAYGKEWTREERHRLTELGYSVYFLSIVLTQIADLIICKTRRLSIFQQGMSNWVLNAGIFFEVSLACLAVYCPGLRTALQFQPVRDISFLVLALPFAIVIILYDELRRLCIRAFPGGLVDKETYY